MPLTGLPRKRTDTACSAHGVLEAALTENKELKKRQETRSDT